MNLCGINVFHFAISGLIIVMFPQIFNSEARGHDSEF